MNDLEWLGLIIAVGGGWVIAGVFHCAVKTLLLKESCKSKPGTIPPWLTGVVERLLFFFLIIAVAPDHADVATAMTAWLALKLGANWQRRVKSNGEPDTTSAMLALLTGALSLAAAYAGGLVAIGAFLPPCSFTTE